MNMRSKPTKRAGFLARLRHDESGNIIAMTAAALLPVIAMVGGAVDMSRLYGVKTRIQAACDAGALTGRRVMGSAAWNTTAENAANAMFSTNFASDFFGVTNLSRDFDGADGRVTGTVSVDVPMTLMRILGQEQRTVSVTCTSEMKIPNTDVMFVLDTTGSMNCAPADNPCTGNGGVEKVDSRMAGLRKSVNCFYEALAKEETGEACNSPNADPTPTGLAAGIQLRIGFMPYSSNINVGKLLPTSYFADSWAYQSRSPVISVINVWNDSGSETFDAWTDPTRPGTGNWNSAANYNTFSYISGTGNETILRAGADTTVARVIIGATAANCTSNNTIDSNKLRIVGDNAGTPSGSTPGASSAPVFGPPQSINRTRTHTRTVPQTVTGYRYAWNGTECRLQSASGKTNNSDTRWTQTQTRTGTIPVAWTTARELTGWTLLPRTGANPTTGAINISGLKNGTIWNNSVTVPDFAAGTATVNKSGANSSSNIDIPMPASISWGGCIEERQTYKNIDTNPDDEWDPVPSTALDMDIDSAPTGAANSLWGPALQGLIFSRSSGGRTLNNVAVSGGTSTTGKLDTLACPTEARKLEIYKSGAVNAAGAARDGPAIAAYTASLRPAGGTYHDIGLLWGARFMSPTGIFGTANSTDSAGNPITIQRHMIFMTDGDTGTCSTSYSPYGIAWWDRRQTNKSDPNDDTGTATCVNSYTNRIVDARTAALCSAIKNKNITLWVVSFGAGVDETTQSRLANCASSSSHFYNATTTSALITSFQEIALQISRLRLQS